MKFFYISSNTSKGGQFEIHEKECSLIPDSLDRDYLGPFNNGAEALRKALSIKPNAVCCEKCCKPAHQAVLSSVKREYSPRGLEGVSTDSADNR